MLSPISRSLFCLCVFVPANGVHAEERPQSIRDDAGLFHADAIARAEQGTAELRRSSDRNLFVQTVASATPQQRGWFPFLRTPQVNRLLEEHARHYADNVGLPGIYVVICRRPRDVHVIVRPADDPLFTRHDAETLRRLMARRLTDNADAALLAAVDRVRATVQEHEKNGPPSVVNEVVLAAFLGGGFLLWLLLVLVRWKTRRRQTALQTERDVRVIPALLGSLFGCPAAFWIYDKLYPSLAPSVDVPAMPSEGNETNETGIQNRLFSERADDLPVSPR